MVNMFCPLMADMILKVCPGLGCVGVWWEWGEGVVVQVWGMCGGVEGMGECRGVEGVGECGECGGVWLEGVEVEVWGGVCGSMGSVGGVWKWENEW